MLRFLVSQFRTPPVASLAESGVCTLRGNKGNKGNIAIFILYKIRVHKYLHTAFIG